MEQRFAIGKTVVTSGIIDRIAAKFGRKFIEVPVGFKWFVDGLDRRLARLRRRGERRSIVPEAGRIGLWTTDKDGIILGRCCPPKSPHKPSETKRRVRSPHARVGRSPSTRGPTRPRRPNRKSC